ncbi:MAG: hypothetical protein AB1916_09000 [Thermodesulfobacteriota bacterium]
MAPHPALRACLSLAVLTLALLPPVPAALADGQGRAATAQEQAAMLRILQAFDRQAPPGPAGWERTEETEVKASEYVGVDQEHFPLAVFYAAAWRDAARLDAAQDRAVQAGAAVMQESAGDPAADRIQQDYEAMAQKLGAAADKGDMAAVQRIAAEMEALAEKMQAAYAAQDRKLDEVFAEHEVRDARLRIHFEANAMSEALDPGYVVEPGPAGLAVYRSEGRRTTHYGWREGYSRVFLGAWKLSSEPENPRMEAAPRPGIPHTAVQTVVVTVQADKARAAAVLKQLDWSALKALLPR